MVGKGLTLYPLPTIGNSLEKHKSLYKVLAPSIKSPYKLLWAYGRPWNHMASLSYCENFRLACICMASLTLEGSWMSLISYLKQRRPQASAAWLMAS